MANFPKEVVKRGQENPVDWSELGAEQVRRFGEIRRLMQSLNWLGLAQAIDRAEKGEGALVEVGRHIETRGEREEASLSGELQARLCGGGDQFENLKFEQTFYRGLALALVFGGDGGDENMGVTRERIDTLAAAVENVVANMEVDEGQAPCFLEDQSGRVASGQTVVGAILNKFRKGEETVAPPKGDEMQVARAALVVQAGQIVKRIGEGESFVDAINDVLGGEGALPLQLKALSTALKQGHVNEVEEKLREVKEGILRGQDPYSALREIFGEDTSVSVALSAVAVAAEERARMMLEKSKRFKLEENITAENLGLPETVKIAGEPIEVDENHDLISVLIKKGLLPTGLRLLYVPYKPTEAGLSALIPEGKMLLGIRSFRGEDLEPVHWQMVDKKVVLPEGILRDCLLVIGDGTGKEIVLLASTGVRDGTLVLVPVKLKEKDRPVAEAWETLRPTDQVSIDGLALRTICDRLNEYDQARIAWAIASNLFPNRLGRFESLEAIGKVVVPRMEEGEYRRLATLLIARILGLAVVRDGKADKKQAERLANLCSLPGDQFGYHAFLLWFLTEGLWPEAQRLLEKHQGERLGQDLDGMGINLGSPDDRLGVMPDLKSVKERGLESTLPKSDWAWARFSLLCQFLVNTPESQELLAKIKVKRGK